MKKAIALVVLFLVAGAVFAQSRDRFLTDFAEAERLLSRSDYDNAYELYNRLIRDSEGRGFAAEIKYRAAQCAYHLGRFEISISMLEDVLREDIIEDTRYYYLEPQVKFSLGLSYFQIGDDDRARRYLDEAEQLGGMGLSDYLLNRDYLTASDHLRQWDYPVDKLFLARSLINTRKAEHLSEILSTLTELSTDESLEELVDFSRAELQFYNRDYTTSKTVFREFMTEYPRSSLRNFAEYYLACTYFHDREYRYAIDLLDKLRDPNKSGYQLAAHANFMRGECYRGLDLPDSAMFSFEQARTVAPNSMVDFYTTYRLYQIHRDEGNIDFARREASRLGTIALYGLSQDMMRNLSNLVQGNIEFYQAPPNYTTAANYYQQVTMQLPYSDSETEELFVYEASMVMHLLSLNRINNRQQYRTAATKPQAYLREFPDSVEVKYGGDWRAYLLYNQADATYYSAYRRGGDVTTANKDARENARDMYQNIIDAYDEAIITTLAKVSLAWYKLEAGRFDDAMAEFETIIAGTKKKDAMVLAAYGQGLAHYYKALTDKSLSDQQRIDYYVGASGWFFNEDDYRSQLGIAVRREDADDRLLYNEIADTLIDKSLFWRARCLENAGYFGNALEVFKLIADNYPDRPKAGEASQKVIEFYIRAGEVGQATDATEEAGRKMARNRSIYQVPYGYGLAALFDYHQSTGNEALAEDYASRLVSELGTTEPIEQFYFLQALDDTSVAQIGELRGYIEKIRVRNPRSQYLPELLYKLSWLLIQDENFDEAQDVLVQFRNWPDVNATRDFMPDAIFMLARVYVATDRFADAVTQLESWIFRFEAGDDSRPDLAPIVNFNLGWAYYNLAQATSSPQDKRDHFSKALSIFESMGDRFGDTDYYQNAAVNINQLIAECRRNIG